MHRCNLRPCVGHTLGSTQSCQLTRHATLTSWTRRYYFFKRLNSYATLYGQYQQKRGQSLKNIWVCIHLLVCSVKHRASWQDKGTSLRVVWEFNGYQTCMRSTGIPDSWGGVTWAQNWPPTNSAVRPTLDITHKAPSDRGILRAQTTQLCRFPSCLPHGVDGFPLIHWVFSWP